MAAITMGSAWALSGCAVGPDFKEPEAPHVIRYTREPLADTTASSPTRGGEAQRFVEGRDIPGEWWTLFHCEALDSLIGRALEGNPSLDAAQAALRQANETVRARRGSLFPTVSAGFEPQRERLDGAIIGQPQFVPTFSVVSASLNVSYVADVFGGTRRQIESLAAQAEQRRFELEATYLTLTSNVVVAAVEEASLREQITATQEIIGIESQELDLVRQRFKVGVVSQADVLLQEAALEQTRATLAPLQKELALLRNELTALAGRLPSEEVGETFMLDDLHLPQELPVSLPSRLVAQRPDVRESAAQLHSASAAVGVAIANELPQLSITAAVGTTATGFTTFPGLGVWSAAANAVQTVFDAGTLEHQKRAARAALDEAAAQYRSTVIASFQNVADALRALAADADTLVADDAAERSARASLDLARRQFQGETADYLTVLAAQRIWETARINRIQAEANRYTDTAALFQALGGGWWHRVDVRDTGERAKDAAAAGARP